METIFAIVAALAAVIAQASAFFDTETQPDQSDVYAEARAYDEPESAVYGEEGDGVYDDAYPVEYPEDEAADTDDNGYVEPVEAEDAGGAYLPTYGEEGDGAVYSEVGPTDAEIVAENPWLEPEAMARAREAYENSPDYGGYAGDTDAVTEPGAEEDTEERDSEEGSLPYSEETKAAMEQCLADLADDPEARAEHCRL